jgi:hypothetical protein
MNFALVDDDPAGLSDRLGDVLFVTDPNRRPS